MEAILKCYDRDMSVEVALRDLRNHTADLLQRVEAGEELVITKRGKPVARLVPIAAGRRRPISREELIEWLENRPVDPEFKEFLDEMDEYTDEDRLDDLWRADS